MRWYCLFVNCLWKRMLNQQDKSVSEGILLLIASFTGWMQIYNRDNNLWKNTGCTIMLKVAYLIVVKIKDNTPFHFWW